MPQEFTPGDFLVFQLEAGYGLLRVLASEESAGDTVWHLAAYRDLFMDVDSAENAAANPASLTVEIPHKALTSRAFQSTQVARIANAPLTDVDSQPLADWRSASDRDVSDRSIRLLLGLR
jgi:hypothetical protein